MTEIGMALPEDLPKPDKSMQATKCEEIRRLRDSNMTLMLD